MGREGPEGGSGLVKGIECKKQKASIRQDQAGRAPMLKGVVYLR
jgi:hypothetical protein